MRFPRKGLVTAILAVTVLTSYRAISDVSDRAAIVDANAFDEAWTGEYYVEPAVEESSAFDSFEEKKDYFLESPEIDHEVEDLDVDANGNPVSKPAEKASESNDLDSSTDDLTEEEFQDDGTESASPSGGPKPSVKPKVQALYYYNRGSLRNATKLDADGDGYVKIFQDRDAARGGRSWGTRSLVSTLRKVALRFKEKFPGRERLQIADMGLKSGGKTSHASHQNGLEADVVYVRKNRREQNAFGGYGKNGFAEQFVIPGKATYRAYRDSRGRKKMRKTSTLKVSHNFDVEANFEVLLMVDKIADVKKLFVDKVLIREFFRHAEKTGRTKDPAVRSMLMKLSHICSHADHFHIRLACQESDPQCKSVVAPPAKRSSAKRKKR